MPKNKNSKSNQLFKLSPSSTSFLSGVGENKMARSIKCKIQSLTMASVIALTGVGGVANAADVVKGSLKAPSTATVTGTESNGLYTSNHYTLVSLARSLGSDRDNSQANDYIDDDEYVERVFGYVRDNIETLPYYGVKKGAVGAYYDNAGTPFDQAMLMVKLLDERNITAKYKFGTLELTGTQFKNLYGITDANAACQILVDGGIPAEINNETTITDCSNSAYNGDVSEVEMDHIWVTVTLNSTDTDYDPSYKIHAVGDQFDDEINNDPFDIAKEMVDSGTFDESNFMTAANVTTSTINGITNITGANITGTSGIEDKLEEYSMNLVTAIRDTQNTTDVRFSNYLKSLDGIVGGRYLDPADQVALTTNTTGAFTNTASTSSNEMPDAYRTKLTIGFGTSSSNDQTLYADQLYGLRLWLDEVSGDTNLMVGNEIHATITGTFTSVDLEVDHPYAASISDYADRIVTITVPNAGDLNGAAIVFDTGATSHQAARHLINESYQTANLDDDAAPANGEMAKIALGGSWAVQYSQLLDLDSGVGDTVYHHHDSMGLITSDGSDNVTAHISSNISVNAENGSDGDRTVSIKTLGTMAAVLESALIEQAGDGTSGNEIRTPASMFTEALEDGNNILAFTNSDYAAVDTEAGHYSQSLRDDIEADLNGGSNERYFMVDTTSGLSGWSAGTTEPFVKYDTDGAGGFYSKIGDTAVSYGNADELADGAASGLPGGNMGDIILDNAPQAVSGEYSDAATDLVTGAGSFPMALPFSRSFQLSRVDTDYKGWRHNYDITAKINSNSLLALSNPVAAAQAIATLKVIRDVNSAGTNEERVMAGILAANWMRKELLDNMFTVRTSGGSDFYYRLADGTYHAMNGSFSTLETTSSPTGYKITSLTGNEMILEHVSGDDYRVQEMIWPNGLGVKFTYSSNTLTVENNVGRSLDVVSSSGKLDYVQDNAGRRVTYSWNGTTGTLEKTELKAQTTAAQNKWGTATTLLSKIELTQNSSTDVWTAKAWDPTDTDASDQLATSIINKLGQIEKITAREADGTGQNGDSGSFYPSLRRGETVSVTGGVSTAFTNHLGITWKVVNALGIEVSSEFYGGGTLYRSSTPLGQGSEFTYNKYGNTLVVKAFPDNGSGTPDWTATNVPETESTYSTTFPHLPASVEDAEGNVTSFTYNTDSQSDTYMFLTKTTLPSISVYDVGLGTSSTKVVETEISYTSSLTASGYTSGGTYGLILPEIFTNAEEVKTHTNYNNLALPTKIRRNYHASKGKGEDGYNIEAEMYYDNLGNAYEGEDHRDNKDKKTLNIRRQVESSYLYTYQDTVYKVSNIGEVYSTNETRYYGQTNNEFDAAGRLTKVTAQYSSSGTTESETKYDVLGRLEKTIDGDGDEVNYTYTTVLASSVSINAPDGGTIIAVSMGEVEADVLDDGNGTITETRVSRVYTDILGRTVRAIRAPGTSAETVEDMGYNDNGQISWVRDGNGNVTRYTYDSYGREDETIYPDTSTTRVADYDKLGRPGELTKRDGSTFELTYDAHNNITQRVVKDSTGTTERTYTFKFDIMGRANYSKVDRGGGNITENTMTYDHFDRKLEEQDNLGYGASYAYDDDAGEVEITYDDPGFAGDSFKVVQKTDFNGNVSQINLHRNGYLIDIAATFAYDQIGRMTSMEVGDKDTMFYYDDDHDLTKVVSFMTNSVTFDYEHNLVGQISGKKVSNTDYIWSPGTQSSTVDNNIINSMNQVKEENGSKINYDVNGNLMAKGDRTLTWSAENYLLKVEEDDGFGGTDILGEYKYDAMGRRVEKDANENDVTRYVYGGNNVIAELDGDSSNTLEYRYIYGPGVDQPIARVSYNSGIDIDYYFYDGQGNVIAFDGDSATEEYTYDPYGNVDDLTGNVYRYTGRRIDAETGYYYYRARYYDPGQGRFLSADPIGYGDGLNMYAYVGNDPMNYRDPSGSEACDKGNCPETTNAGSNSGSLLNPWGSLGQALGAVGTPGVAAEEEAVVAAVLSGVPGALHALWYRYDHSSPSYSVDWSNGLSTSGLSGWILAGRAENIRLKEAFEHNAMVRAVKDIVENFISDALTVVGGDNGTFLVLEGDDIDPMSDFLVAMFAGLLDEHYSTRNEVGAGIALFEDGSTELLLGHEVCRSIEGETVCGHGTPTTYTFVLPEGAVKWLSLAHTHVRGKGSKLPSDPDVKAMHKNGAPLLTRYARSITTVLHRQNNITYLTVYGRKPGRIKNWVPIYKGAIVVP